jgi:DNA-binding beta-propeller fold protein YncE
MEKHTTARRCACALSVTVLFLVAGPGHGAEPGGPRPPSAAALQVPAATAAAVGDTATVLRRLVNIDATMNDASNPVMVAVPAGRYQAKLVDPTVHPAAAFTAWTSTGQAGAYATHYRIRDLDGKEFFGGRATAADSAAEAMVRTPNRAMLVDVPSAQSLRFYINDPTLEGNAGGVSVLLEPARTLPGRIGADPAGALMVRLGEQPGTLDLEWGPSCSQDATDYAVYEGAIGDWTSHVPKAPVGGSECTTSGETSATVAPGTGSRYYLVAPLSEFDVGSFGTGAFDVPRPWRDGDCRPIRIDIDCLPREETIFIGAGDVNAHETYNGILRITQRPPADSGDCTGTTGNPLYTPDASVAMSRDGDLVDDSTSSSPAYAIFPHGIFYSAATGELFVAGTYTTDDPGGLPEDPCAAGAVCPPDDPQLGSLGVIEAALSLAVVSDEPLPPPRTPSLYSFDRHVFHRADDTGSDVTTLNLPHSVWYDDAHEEIYVANSKAQTVAVFDHDAEGNAAPLRSFTSGLLSVPFSVAYDETTDTLFVGTLDVDPSDGEQGIVAVFKDAFLTHGSTTGDVPDDPDLIVCDPSWGRMIHNVWYDLGGDAVWIGNHSDFVYRGDLEGLLGATSSSSCDTTGARCSLSTTVPTCNVGGLALNVNWFGYSSMVTGGIWFHENLGRLYVAVGANDGQPIGGLGNHAVFVYDDARNLFGPAFPAPDRTVCWDSSDVYFGPQPISVVLKLF